MEKTVNLWGNGKKDCCNFLPYRDLWQPLGVKKFAEIHKNRPHQLVGRTATDYIVVFNGQEVLAGEFVKVKITRTSPLTLFGEMI